MEQSILRIAVVGLGNIGHASIEAIQMAPDMELAGIVRRNPSDGKSDTGIPPSTPVVSEVSALGKVDVALLCGPSRSIPEIAPRYLSQGISTVDSFDIHGAPLAELRQSLMPLAKEHACVAILSAGWDPGSDSMIRALFLAMVPRGLTHTNFGPGMSMGHSVAAKSIAGVKDALSVTVPIGSGAHRRMVYVALEKNARFEEVKTALLQDPYFSHDDTRVHEVACVDDLKDMGHGVHLERRGVSGKTHNQHLELRMRINNPALTGQIMVSCARAAKRLSPGAYTMPEIPPIDFLPGTRESWIPTLI